MKRLLLAAILPAVCAAVFAYNPPYGGEELFRLTNPELMMGAASASGGPAFTVLPSSIVYNPAIPAGQQRVDIDLSATLLLNVDKVEYEGESTDDSAGGGFQVGLIIPTKWSVFSFTTSAMFSDMYGMNLRNTWIMHGGASKELNENFSVGANVYTGFYMGSGSDYSIGVDLGVLFKLDDMERLKEPRVGFALLNLGKPADYDTLGLDYDDESSYYPSPLTPRASFAATFFQTESWTGAFSADAAIPFFQNLIADAAVAFCCNDFVTLSAAWQLNMREIIEGGSDGLSWFSIGISFKFGITSKTISEKNADWEQSEITPSFATQHLYSGIQAISVGTRLDLGLKDTDAPEILLWEE